MPLLSSQVVSAAAVSLLLLAHPYPTVAADGISFFDLFDPLDLFNIFQTPSLDAEADFQDGENQDDDASFDSVPDKRQIDGPIDLNDASAIDIFGKMNLCAAYLVSSDKIAVSYPGNGVFQLSNYPEVCGDVIEAWNNAPSISQAAAKYAVMKWNKGNTTLDLNNAGHRNSAAATSLDTNPILSIANRRSDSYANVPSFRSDKRHSTTSGRHIERTRRQI